MADQIIDIPGVGAVAFPDSMKPEEIRSAASKLYAEQQNQKPVVIRDDTGREHVFPPGFDPQRATQIVARAGYIKASPTPANAEPSQGRPIGVFTSLAAPELQRLRKLTNDALATPPGTPIMARSRTGQLYRSEIGTPETSVKGALRGIADVGFDQLEGATSPLGIATLGATDAVGGLLGSAAGTARQAVREAAPLISKAGTALETVASRAQKPLSWLSAYELMSARSPVRSALAYATPYVTSAAGRGLERLSRAASGVDPLFESAADKVQRLLKLYDSAPEVRELTRRALDRVRSEAGMTAGADIPE